MRLVKLALVGLLLSCGPPAGPAAPDGPGVGELGAVCHCGPQGGPECAAVACKPGLMCGYPCGVAGCNSVCMTREDFNRSSEIP
jgi:hypothetical protein